MSRSFGLSVGHTIFYCSSLGAWLLEQKRLSGFNPILQPQKQLVSGESFYLLGHHYRLKVFESNYDSVDILDDRIILNCTFPEDHELKRSLLLKWYMKKATDIFNGRFHFYTQFYSQTNLKLSVKKLSKRWGEFHPGLGVIVLNAELVVAPIECIDYVGYSRTLPWDLFKSRSGVLRSFGQTSSPVE